MKRCLSLAFEERQIEIIRHLSHTSIILMKRKATVSVSVDVQKLVAAPFYSVWQFL